MITLGVKAAQANFFDREKVMRAVSRARRKALSKAGAGVRKKAQKSIQMGDRPSRPGSPPHGHKTGLRKRVSKSTGRVRFQQVSPLREFIFFSYDAARDSVVIGPAILNGKGGARVLSSLEYGGPSVVVENGKRTPIVVQARPFMRPALEAEQKVVAEVWRGSVRA